MTLANLAVCLHAQGRMEEAERLAVEAASMSEDVLGDRHPETRLARANLAAIRRLARS